MIIASQSDVSHFLTLICSSKLTLAYAGDSKALAASVRKLRTLKYPLEEKFLADRVSLRYSKGQRQNITIQFGVYH